MGTAAAVNIPSTEPSSAGFKDKPAATAATASSTGGRVDVRARGVTAISTHRAITTYNHPSQMREREGDGEGEREGKMGEEERWGERERDRERAREREQYEYDLPSQIREK